MQIYLIKRIDGEQVRGFHPQNVVLGSDFLDRDAETEALRRRLELGQNTLLVAPRRFGKSSLILETFRRAGPAATCLYVDLFPATSEQEAAERILGALYAATASRSRRLLDWLIDHLTGIGLVIRHAASGVEVEFTGATRKRHDIIAALDTLEAYAVKRDAPVHLALDEFQRVLDWRGGDATIAAIRSAIQHHDRTTYLFSGSKKHVLLGLVSDPAQPFWQQLDVMELGGIGIDHFAAYARARFDEQERPIDPASLARVAHWCRDNPKRTQELLQGLLLTEEAPSPELVDRVADEQVRGQRHLLRSLLDQVKSMIQLRLLSGLARHDDESAAAIYSGAFIAAHHLGSPGSARSAFLALQDAGILDQDHRFTDPYLKHHLRESIAGRSG
jgi:uncharacterized protein